MTPGTPEVPIRTPIPARSGDQDHVEEKEAEREAAEEELPGAEASGLDGRR
jgi:hypothetical protein